MTIHNDASPLVPGPEERPKRNTLDDRLRAFEDLLSMDIPHPIDALNRRSARLVITDARAELHRLQALTGEPPA